MKIFSNWKPLFAALAVCFVGAGSVPASDLVANFRLPSPKLETLANGLTVAWFLDDSLPIFDVAMMVKSGNRDDLPGKSGTAALVSDLLERGAAGISAVDLSKRFERLGASSYSASDDDAMSLGVHGLSQDAPELLDLLAKMMLQPDFKEEEFQRERSRLGDRWSHLADSAESLASFVYARVMANGTTYARGSLRSLSELKGLRRSDILQFYRTHFTPKNSVLMVVGRVNQPEFRAQIQTLFGGWTGEEPKRKYRNYTQSRFSMIPNEVRVVDRPGVPQAQVRIGFPVPSLYSKNRYALAVGNALLGEYFNSRLNSVIRDRMGLAYGISSNIAYSKGLAYLTIGSATASPNVGTLLQKTLETLRSMKGGDVSEEEVAVAKDYMLGGYPLSVSTLGAVASRWLGGYVYDLGPDYLNEFVPKVKAVNRAAVVRAVQEAFNLDRVVIVVSGDAKQIEPALKKAGFKTIRRVSSANLM